MDSTVKEIREHFAAMRSTGIIPIKVLDPGYPAYVIRTGDEYGVAITVDDNMVVSERFNSCRFHTLCFAVDGTIRNWLILGSSFEDYRYEFASLCAEFVEPGEDGCVRKEILENPHAWWKRWKELVGNTNRERTVYDTIAELLVLEQKLAEDPATQWAAAIMSSHDIECSEESAEVKSTLRRYDTIITIAGQHQLEHTKPLSLYFCRMEESLEGISINDMKPRLAAVGYDEGKLELQLEKRGYERGASIRDKKYKVLEKKRFAVNDAFPKIVSGSFKENRIPDKVTQITYTLNLEGVDSTPW